MILMICVCCLCLRLIIIEKNMDFNENWEGEGAHSPPIFTVSGRLASNRMMQHSDDCSSKNQARSIFIFIGTLVCHCTLFSYLRICIRFISHLVSFIRFFSYLFCFPLKGSLRNDWTMELPFHSTVNCLYGNVCKVFYELLSHRHVSPFYSHRLCVRMNP